MPQHVFGFCLGLSLMMMMMMMMMIDFNEEVLLEYGSGAGDVS